MIKSYKNKTKKSKSTSKKHIQQDIPLDIKMDIIDLLSNDDKTLHNLSQTNKIYKDIATDLLKLKKQIENCLVFDSSNKNDIVTEYFLKQKTTYEDQEKNIDYFIDNFALFVKTNLNFDDLPDYIKQETGDKNLSVIWIWDKDELYYNKELLDKRSERYKFIKANL